MNGLAFAIERDHAAQGAGGLLFAVRGGRALKRVPTAVVRRVSRAGTPAVCVFTASMALAHHPLAVLRPARSDGD
jgi:hypothetical protein